MNSTSSARSLKGYCDTSDRDYQLAQLSLSLASVDEKLSQIPVVRAPRNGYIRRIKPWIGNNGKYTTTLTISNFTPDIKSYSGKSPADTSSQSNTSRKNSGQPSTTTANAKSKN
ncbi:hypothetical protein [Iningainema tapete]|uniref:hypothetical protein n=1 Tax=Iningainema tapete TaxID=2806730 RepID=UPI001EE2ACC6|nr:hypothetical protein [Iningainema tapete]